MKNSVNNYNWFEINNTTYKKLQVVDDILIVSLKPQKDRVPSNTLLLGLQIDLKKMPLGKLSKKQIQDAYKILTELTQLIDSKGTPTQFLDASNRFYTLIPHDFGMKKPPLLDTAEVVKVSKM